MMRKDRTNLQSPRRQTVDLFSFCRSRLFVALLFMHAVSFPAWSTPFDDFQVSGPCSKRSMDVIENGDVLSILLRDFGATMPLGETGDGQNVRRVCQFQVRVTFPADQYLAGMTQVFSGGVIKSRRASGQLHIFSRILRDISLAQPLRWPAGEAIGPESARSNFTVTLEEKLQKPQVCRGRLFYQTRLTLQAARPTVNQDFFIGAVDTIDTELSPRVDLIPNWQRCDGKPMPTAPKRPRPRERPQRR